MKKKDKISRAKPNNLMIYKNLMISLFAIEEKIIVAVMNLDDFGISACKPAQKEHFSCLFLLKAKPDIVFKVENRPIYAHKQALVKNSPHFANLFNRGMMGPRQDMMKIKDCEHYLFKKYVLFLYQGRIQFDDSNQALKLYALAEKYLQEDLCEECVNFLSQNINEENAYTILDFAHEKSLLDLKSCCMKFFYCSLQGNMKNMTSMIQYLGRQEDSQFKENNKELRNFAFSFVLDHFFEIYEKEKGNVKIYEGFLFKNIEMDTLPALANFVSFCQKLPEDVKNHLKDIERNSNKSGRCEIAEFFEDSSDESDDEGKLGEGTIIKTKTLFEERIVELREAALSFTQENAKAILTNETSEDVLRDFTFSSLFLSQTESDITLKVEDQLLPAHKQFLVKKSRYFGNVFNSGMAESRQDVIDIQDCEYDIFKEYLRFIYQGRVELDDSNQAIKLHALADKYLQEDLCEECVSFLSHNIKENNFYAILDFAHEQHISNLKNCCVKFFKGNLKISNVAKMIEYLDHKEEDPEFKENNKEFINFAFNFVLYKFFDIHENEKGRMQTYEDFLLKNIELDTIAVLVRFLDCSYTLPEEKKSPLENIEKQPYEDSSDEEPIIRKRVSWEPYYLPRATAPKTKDLFDERTSQLKKAAFNFIQENVKTVLTKKISEGFSKDFLRDFAIHVAEKTSGREIDMSKDTQENSKGNRKKRMEPVQDGVDEENPTLKKTKISDEVY